MVAAGARAKQGPDERRPTIYARRLIWQHCLRARKQFVPNTRLLFCDIIADSARPRSQGGPFLRRIFLSHRAIRNSPGRDRGLSLTHPPFYDIEPVSLPIPPRDSFSSFSTSCPRVLSSCHTLSQRPPPFSTSLFLSHCPSILFISQLLR